MNRIEVQKILMEIEVIYPNFKNGITNPTALIDIWHKFLQKYDYADISTALIEFVETSNNSFAPSISQLIGIVKKHKDIPIKISLLGAAEAWGMVRKALQNSAYNCEAEFEKLPKLIQKAVGSANQLQVWATDEDYNEGVISSVFKRNYEEVCNKEMQYRELTPEQKQGVDSIRQQILDGKDLNDICSPSANLLLESTQNTP